APGIGLQEFGRFAALLQEALVLGRALGPAAHHHRAAAASGIASRHLSVPHFPEPPCRDPEPLPLGPQASTPAWAWGRVKTRPAPMLNEATPGRTAGSTQRGFYC